MNAYTITAIIITLAVSIGYLNYRFIHLQMSIAIMIGAMFLSLLLIAGQHLGFYHVEQHAEQLVSRLDFRSLLLNGMLSFLLFAGAFTVDFDLLKENGWLIGILASISTIISALIIGALCYYLLPLIGLHLKFIYCMLFGALISPTDPIAVLATFKEIGAPKQIEVCVAGESLFNDGVGIVIFTTLYAFAFTGHAITASGISLLFLQQAIGGLAFGLLVAWIVDLLIIKGSGPKMIILLMLVVVTGAYQFALAINISGPLAMVVAGIYLGHRARSGHYGSRNYEIIEVFWEVIDEILNAILFLLIGLEILTIHIHGWEVVAALVAIPLVLLVRLVTVAVPMKYFGLIKAHAPYAISILTWGGLRGGLAVALALSLPDTPSRGLILGMTYAIVAFAVIIQGITIRPLARMAQNSQKLK